MDIAYYIAAYLGVAVAHVLLLVLMSRRGHLGDVDLRTDEELLGVDHALALGAAQHELRVEHNEG